MEAIVSGIAKHAIEQSGLTANAAARRARLSTATVHRILHGQGSPSIATLHELITACGLQLDITSRPASDPRAAAAARALLDPEYTEDGPPGWTARLQRWSADDPMAMTIAAAEHSGLYDRPEAHYFQGHLTIGRLASAGGASGQPWCLSGAAGLSLPQFTASAPSPTVLWVKAPERAAQLLGDAPLRPAMHPTLADLIVAPADDALFAGSFTIDQVRFAAPLQVMLDCISLGGQVRAAAEKEMGTW